MTKELRQVYVNTVLDIASKDESVYVLEADLAASMGTIKIKDQLQGHYIDVGIAEGQEICVAAGIAAAQGLAFVHSFAPFITRRVFDHIFVSLAYAQLDAIIVGSDAGITTEANGGTHMCFEDMALMRAIPNCTVYDVSDPEQFETILRHCYQVKGLNYIRTGRKAVLPLYNGNVNVEKGYNVLKEGKDATLFACGVITSEALKAADILLTQGIDISVVNIHRIKPLPEDIIVKSSEKGPIFVVENHNVIGGLRSAISEFVSENCPCYVYPLGVNNRFGQVGLYDFLLHEYELDAKSIANKIHYILNK